MVIKAISPISNKSIPGSVIDKGCCDFFCNLWKNIWKTKEDRQF